MAPETLRLLLLGGSAIVIAAIGYTLIWMVMRMRNTTQRRKRRTKAAQRRVDAAIERAELSGGTLTMPDRFEAVAAREAGKSVLLTAEPQHGDLGMSVVAPQPPFDVADRDVWARWEGADRNRRQVMMLAGYLSHPLPRVRTEALDLLADGKVRDADLPARLALLVLDDERTLRTRAARKSWESDRLSGVVAALTERAPADHSRAYAELEQVAPTGRGLALPRAVGEHWGDGAGEAALIAELVELYAPDRADRESAPDIGRRLDVEGGAAARERAAAALTAVRGRAAAEDADSRWSGIGS